MPGCTAFSLSLTTDSAILVCGKVVGFTGSSEAFLIDSTNDYDLAVVDDGSEHGSGRLHGCQLPPLRLFVVVGKHFIEGFAVEKKVGDRVSEELLQKLQACSLTRLARMIDLRQLQVSP